jgi:hypothetical protein
MPHNPLEEKIAELAPAWSWRRPGPITDPIWMEYQIEVIDPALRAALSAVRLETVAAVHRTIADGISKAAEILHKTSGR